MKRNHKDRLWLVIAAVMLVSSLGFLYLRADTDPRDKFAPQYASYDEYKGVRKGQRIETVRQLLGEPVGEYLLDDSTLVYLYPIGGPAPDHLHVYLKARQVVGIGHSL